jgi:predicted transcriptional regulator
LDTEAVDIVISVKEEYLAMILKGDKTIELRRKAINVPPGSRVWLYAKSPIAHISACATVQRVVTGTPRVVWNRYRSEVGITRDEFNSYFKGSSTACAILLGDVRGVVPALKLRDLRSRLNGFHPPQFFKKLYKGSPEFSLLRSHMA